ncbi:MAG: CBS domain-containing protein [Oligoflexia bacterium]|nr:MAG: CBS domain-containing protein [Oligoflexia bacterium]
MPISDLCSRELVCVERGTSLRSAAQLMKKKHVGGVVIVEANGKKKPVGILTDRDIVLSVVAEDIPLSSRVESVMTGNVIKVQQEEGIATVVDKMEREGVRRMVVVDAAGNACGLVSSDDILQLVAKELNGIGKLFEKQIENEKSYGAVLT